MNRFSRVCFSFVLIFSLSLMESCNYVKKVDTLIRKTFGSVNKFERKKKAYSRRLGGKNNKSGARDDSGDDKMFRNPIHQKNMINKYGYLFEGINGKNPGIIVNYQNKDSTSNKFELENKNFKTIKSDQEVFGWHPYWMGSKWKNYPFNLLSTISYFSYSINPSTGLCQNPEQILDWKTSAMIDSAKAKNTRVLLTVSLHGEKNNENFLKNKLLWTNLYDDISKLIIERNADGVDINFENVPYWYSLDFVNFVSGFKESLSLSFADNNKAAPFISLSLPADNNKENYNLKKLDPLVDLFIILGYDYQSNSTPGAVSPLQSDGGFSLKKTLEYYKQVGLDHKKTILAFPYYGIMWEINPDKKGSFKANIERKLTYSEIKKLFLEKNKLGAEVELDPISMSKIYRAAFDDLSIKEIHFDDVFTLSKKYDFTLNNNLKGIGLWALGYDNGEKDLWGLIERYFSTEIKVLNDPIAEINGFPVNFAKRLVQKRDVFIAIIIYFLLAIVASFVIVLNDWRVRNSIMRNKINQLIVVFIGFVLLSPLVVFINEMIDRFGFNLNSTWEIFIGFFLGLLIFYIASKTKFDKLAEKP